MDNYIVYFVHGNSNHFNELYYSLLSFFKFNKNENIKILIYTDNVSFIKEKFPKEIVVIPISEVQIKDWKGTINFNHRVKIKILQEVTSNYNGNFLYLDSDTYFTDNCSTIFNKINTGELFFDKCEGKLIDNNGGVARKMKTFLKQKNQFSTEHDSKIEINQDFIVWNAGVIGFNSSYSNQLILVEQLVDVLYSECRLFIMEQIAFNYYLQKNSYPKTTDNEIHHYWYFKEFRLVLSDFFNYHKSKSFEELLSEIDKINPISLSIEKVNYKKMSFWKKQFHRITKGRKWKIVDYKL